MSLLKISPQILLVVFLIFSNFWIYRIFKLNFLVGIIITILTFIIARTFNNRKSFFISAICILILLVTQYKTTDIQNLTLLDNDQQRVQSERILSYPLTYIDLYFKVIWLKPEVWIEQNSFIIALSKIEQNLFENLNLNKFFFGGFPGNKPEDFEKFTFILLPVFLIGLFKLLKNRNLKVFVLLTPILLLSIIGNKNILGPFSIFPFFVLTFLIGINVISERLKNQNFLYLSLVFTLLIGFLIQISYAKV